MARNDYDAILAEYPEYISKDQMYQLCHISKKTCLFLLESGLVPCIDTGKKTYRFKIKTADVVEYMRMREEAPERYRVPDGYYKRGKQVSLADVITEGDLPQMRRLYEERLEGLPDVLTVAQVAQFTGYTTSSVSGWCSRKALPCFLIRRRFHIPKVNLLDFLVSEYYIGIAVKSDKHKAFNREIRKLRRASRR